MKLKHLLSIALCLAFTMPLFAQSADNDDEVVKIAPQNMKAYRPGEVIVKFKETGAVRMSAPRKTAFCTSSVSTVDNLFQALGVDTVEELMPLTGKKSLPRRIKTYSGEIETKSLDKLYRLKLSAAAMQSRSVMQVIDTLKTLSEVEYAEPNYIVYCMSSGEGDSATYCAEPLYSQQWGLSAINLPALWNKPKVTTKRPVIAILDTGVDIDHPDLAANIWTNRSEKRGAENQDDDYNGFIDDIHGWDFINQTADIHDYNGHGTHCAGIAAAVGNNGIGVTGANPDAYIMPVSVMQSDGTGDVATIIKGIDYASSNGADVISMSIGSYAYSYAEEQALARAYTTSVLVAAAGNDGKGLSLYPMYPAAFTFVLGVEASVSAEGGKASFSNTDPDGPIYSTYDEEQLYNYELRAPGVNIYSTFPNSRYKSLNGTSMACPLAAGAISRLLQCKADSDIVSKEVLFGDLIHSRQNFSNDVTPGSIGNIDMLKAYNFDKTTRTPTIWQVGIVMKDTITDSGDDSDGQYDAGETICLYPILRNDWGTASNIRMWMRLGYDLDGDWVLEDTTLIDFLTDTVSFGHTLSSYAKSVSANPIRFTINPNTVDGRHINMTLFTVCDGSSDTLKQTTVIKVNNGVEIGGMIDQDMTLYPNVHYIVTTPLAILAGVTLTIKPGTTIKFKDNTGLACANGAYVVAIGTPDSLITFTNADGETGNYTLNFGNYDPYDYSEPFPNTDTYSLEYLRIENMWTQQEIRYGAFKNCIFTDCTDLAFLRVKLYRCSVINNANSINLYTCLPAKETVFAANKTKNISWWGTSSMKSRYDSFMCQNVMYPQYDMDNTLNQPNYKIFSSNESNVSIVSAGMNYFGSAEESVIRRYVDDNQSGSGYQKMDFSKRLLRPSANCHGVVWKVLIDGWDAQDQFDSIPALGVGVHTCQVYFNRAMDISKTPAVCYGVRSPYTQHAISENGTWSSDSTIYSASFTITSKTQSDGLNRIYVADVEDNEHFEIPVENLRFNMQIESAGSMSTGLMAIPDAGKITLTWETDEQDYEDLLGYNIYRWTDDTIRWDGHYDSNSNYVEAGWGFDTIQVNSSLLDSQDSMLVDYDVVSGKTYYYMIKQLTTSFAKITMSNVVKATTSLIKGDTNGSFTVDVADIVTDTRYLASLTPDPFIKQAAYVNYDDTIDSQDITATIRLIMQSAIPPQVGKDTAYYYVQNGDLYVWSAKEIGGIEVIANTTSALTPLSPLVSFDKAAVWLDDDAYLFMAYSMSNLSVASGTNMLLRVGNATIQSVILSDVDGHNMVCLEGVPDVPSALDNTDAVSGSTRKVFRDGCFYILREDRLYDFTGRRVE